MPQRDGSGAPVFNAMPPAVLILGLSIMAVVVIDFVSPGLGRWIYASGVLIAAEPGTLLPAQPLGPWAPYLLHVFLHAGFWHIVLNMAVLISAGRPVGMAFGTGPRGAAGFLILFFACALAGAALQVFLHSGDPVPMVGASTGVSGLIAAVGWVTGGWRGMARLALPWIVINLGIAVAEHFIALPIAWAGHIGGTLAGAVLTPLLLGVFSEREF